VLFGSFPIFAGYKMGDEAPVQVKGAGPGSFPSQGPHHPGSEASVLKNLSDRFEIPIDRLVYFRRLHDGYEEIVPALIVAREAQVEAGKILKLRMEGQTWKTIADSYSIDLKPLNEEVLSVLDPIRKVVSKKALEEKPQVRGDALP